MIGEKIRQLIESQSKYSKLEVAEKIGVTDSTIYNLMKKDSVETKHLQALCDLFDIPMTYFFDDKPKKSKSLDGGKFGSEVVIDLLKEQLKEKDRQIFELIQRVGKGEGVSFEMASLLFLLVIQATNWLTPLA